MVQFDGSNSVGEFFLLDGFLLRDELDYKVVHVGLADAVGPPKLRLVDLDHKVCLSLSNIRPIEFLPLMLNHNPNILQ